MRVLIPALLLALTAPGCQEPDANAIYKQSPRADVSLAKASATLTQTSTTNWTLQKVGSLGTSTITWQATATQGTTQSGLLIFNGIFKVQNKGTAGATIGNIVVNLQAKNAAGKWVTLASDIADGTQDDAATTAFVAAKATSENKTSFTESTASGNLLFTDATTNSAFALVPQVTIPAKTTQKLRFSASFDNNVLALANGTPVRAEIIVSFGNAKAGGSSTANVDINGNGIIDGDELWIQSVSSRITTAVPASSPSNSNVTLSDSVSDITTTGTATFSNAVITINGTQAFVVVNYDGGTAGGTITNCAHLTGTGQTVTVDGDQFPNVTAIDLTTCDTQTVGPHACTPGTVGCGWDDGQVITYIQDDWGTPATVAGTNLNNNFAAAYASSFGIVEIGLPLAAGYSISFTSVSAVFGYQPSSGPAGPLNADLVDPASSASGVFGGEVLALRFNIDFSDLGYTAGSTTIKFGDLTICNATGGITGITVRAFQDLANTALGGGTTPYDINDLNLLTQDLNSSFDGGAPSLFAQDHLFNGACPP